MAKRKEKKDAWLVALEHLQQRRAKRLAKLSEEDIRQNVEDAAAWLEMRPTLVPLEEDTLQNLKTDAEAILEYVKLCERQAKKDSDWAAGR